MTYASRTIQDDKGKCRPAWWGLPQPTTPLSVSVVGCRGAGLRELSESAASRLIVLVRWPTWVRVHIPVRIVGSALIQAGETST
jgi:hypothetical protein